MFSSRHSTEQNATELPSHLQRALGLVVGHLLPPGVEDDALERRPAVLLASAMLVGALLLLGFALSQVLTGLYVLALTSVVVAMIVAGLLAWYRAGGPPELIANVFMGIAFVGQLVGAISTGGIVSFTLPSLALYPLFGFIFLGIRGGVSWSGTVLLALLCLYGLEVSGVRIPFAIDRSEVPAQVLGNLLVLVAFGQTLMHWQLRTNELQQQALEGARREADLANEAKSRFLANMSHELRTPMNAVIGLAELTLTRAELDEVDATALGTVLRSSRVMVHLLDDLLDLSRAESGLVEMEQIPLHPARLIDEIQEVLSERARRNRVSLGVDVAADVGFGLGDPARLRQVLTNLMGNAVKFTQDGEVQVQVRRNGERVRFEVRDTGVGIAPDALRAVFQPFVQADASTTRNYGGTGLGLAIAQRLVGLMDGDLQVSSVEGQGSTFSFDIALPACDAAEEAPRERLSLPPLDATITILVAEDNPVNQAVIRRQLEVLQIHTTIVDDGEQALTCMLEQSFDVVLMDLHMPKLDGLGATRAARERGYEGPIVAMTASALLEDRAAAKEAGMTAFLEKPVTLEALVGMLGEGSVGAIPASSVG